MAAEHTEYHLLRLLGEGASSEVWLGVNAESGQEVALKVARSEEHAGRLAEEAHRLLFADSPFVARVLDAGRFRRAVATPEHRRFARGTAYVALEWIAGEPLVPDRITHRDRCELAFIVARDVGYALTDLHAGGTAHGDVKPANIVLVGHGRDTRARLVDLGLADDVDAVVPRGATPRYLAPEVTLAPGTGDAAARDLWALGVTLIEIATAEAARTSRPQEMTANVRDPELHAILEALLSPSPAARALPGWVARRGAARVPEPDSERTSVARRIASVQRAYLAVRRTELATVAHAARTVIEVGDPPRGWLREAIDREQRVWALRGSRRDESVVLHDLDSFGRARWLVRLVGASAASWPSATASDAELATRLVALAAEGPLELITLREITSGTGGPAVTPTDPVELALSLATGRPGPIVVDSVETLVHRGECPPSLGIALGRALRLGGETARALAVLARLGTPEAAVQAAETARRARDLEGCRVWLERAVGADDRGLEGRRAATAARMVLDGGDPRGALAALADAPESAATLEVRALATAALGERERAIGLVERAWPLAHDHEDRARLAGVRATLEHKSGSLEAALVSFRQAVNHAVEAGAVLEEATYLTGVAAAAARFGHLGEALDAAARSTLLFEHLGRAPEAARSALTRAAVFAQLGAREETRDAARDAIARARSTGDRQCQACAHLALSDALAADDRNGLEHALRARTLLEDAEDDARLRAEARVLRRGGSVDVVAADRVARSVGTAFDARLDWWGARASAKLAAHDGVGADQVLAEITALAAVIGLPAERGPALADGAALAAFVGDGETARRLAQGAAECARELLSRVPSALRARLAAQPWLTATLAEPSPLLPAQIADLENLVRALGGRDRLRPLLDQALDALVLWTGVERGLLLLRAPGGRLVPRAARNLRRDDLVGVQRDLSHSLAERAMISREPVVAVDATGELPEVHQSVHALRLRSVLAVPLVSRGEVLGVVYLDDRVRRGAFGPRELAWVRLIATLAAVAIDDARDQLVLRRTARRAQRAERRLADELVRRELALDVAERALAEERGKRGTRQAYEEFVGESAPLRALLRLVDRVTQADVPVLIVGESGTGKDLVARAIHHYGPRARAAFVTENCSAIPEPLLESALFGHVRGAFTGAERPRAGLFDAANGGTLFLDEIGEMSLAMQAKLLRVLETGEVRPVGADRTRRIDVRVLAATHRDLPRLVTEGRFREDLLYRLDVITVVVPPLRDRPGDLDLLVRHFLTKHAPSRTIQVSPQAMAMLRRYPWPGNVRQLENELRRALILCEDIVTVDHLSAAVAESNDLGDGVAKGLDVRLRVDALERELVREAMTRTLGNQTRAAELLGLSRFGLQKMIRRLGVVVEPVEPENKARSK
ncbi:MAG: sigma 54-interacting transcriptional regulator [Polyangiaceae bacterium]|nr:sigma 54-interacting transcriptional regulator [Polyangiaceae bacterium]